jgi:hypothetical protein
VSPIRIDVLTKIDGVPSFNAAWRRRCEGRYGSAVAHFLGLEDLIASERAAGRPQDLADIASLERAAARRKR